MHRYRFSYAILDIHQSTDIGINRTLHAHTFSAKIALVSAYCREKGRYLPWYAAIFHIKGSLHATTQEA